MRGLQKMALLALLAAALLLAAPVAAMFPGMGGNKPPPKVPAVKADIPFIKCQVCEAIIKQAREVVKDLRAGLKPKQKVTQSAVANDAIGEVDGNLGCGTKRGAIAYM